MYSDRSLLTDFRKCKFSEIFRLRKLRKRAYFLSFEILKTQKLSTWRIIVFGNRSIRIGLSRIFSIVSNLSISTSITYWSVSVTGEVPVPESLLNSITIPSNGVSNMYWTTILLNHLPMSPLSLAENYAQEASHCSHQSTKGSSWWMPATVFIYVSRCDYQRNILRSILNVEVSALSRSCQLSVHFLENPLNRNMQPLTEIWNVSVWIIFKKVVQRPAVLKNFWNSL